MNKTFRDRNKARVSRVKSNGQWPYSCVVKQNRMNNKFKVPMERNAMDDLFVCLSCGLEPSQQL